MNPFKSSFNRYDYFEKTYTVDEVLDFYTPEKEFKEYDGNLVKMNSQRYHTFKEKGCKCTSCSRVGTIFRLQRNFNAKQSGGRYHFGLWSEDNIQMTKDHIIPKSLGGADTIDNYVTMCEECNFNKGNSCSENDIKNGKVKTGFKQPLPQANIGSQSNQTEEIKKIHKIKQTAKRIKSNDEEYHDNSRLIQKYMTKHKINIYLDRRNVPEHLILKLEHNINLFREIILEAKGDISPSAKALNGIPKNYCSILIKEIQLELKNKGLSHE